MKLGKKNLQKDVDYKKFRKDSTNFSKLLKIMQPVPKSIKITKERLGEVPCLYAKPVGTPKCTILYLHGGAFILGLKHTAYEGMIGHLAESCEADVWAVDYRIAPEHKLHAALDDCYSAYMDLLNKGVDPQTIFVMGDSAGGYLTLALLLKIRDEGKPLPKAGVPLSPVTGADSDKGSYKTKANEDPMLTSALLQYAQLIALDGKKPSDAPESPINKDLKGMPPLLIMVGGKEILYDDSVLFAEKAKAAGVDVTLDINEKMFHVYPIFVGIFPEANVGFDKIVAFVKAQMD